MKKIIISVKQNVCKFYHINYSGKIFVYDTIKNIFRYKISCIYWSI